MPLTAEEKSKLESNPADVIYHEVADRLRKDRLYGEAAFVCIRALCKNPSLDRARLLLAKIYFEGNVIQFALRELEVLYKNNQDNDSVKRLIDSISPGAADKIQVNQNSVEKVVAESHFKVKDIE